jgi:WD40 repeat protein
MSDNHQIHMYDIKGKVSQNGKLTAILPPAKADRKRINSIEVIPGSKNFISAGIGEHLYFWNVSNKMQGKKISINSRGAVFTNVKHSAKSNSAFVSCSNGNVYTLNGSAVVETTKVHEKPILALNVVQNQN